MTARSLFLILSALYIAGCDRPGIGDESQAFIRFPEKLFSKDVGSLSETVYQRLCFAANITGEGISSTKPNCTPTLGIFKGTIGPGGELALLVPYGLKRKLEVFAYLRSEGEACPAGVTSFSALDTTKIYLLGSVASFDVKEPEQQVQANIVLPVDSLKINATHGIATTCAPTPPVATDSKSRGSIGSRHVSGSAEGYTLRGGLEYVEKYQIETTGGHIVEMD